MSLVTARSPWGAVRTLALTWLLAVVVVARFGLLQGEFPVPQAILVVMAAVFGFAVARVPAIHDPFWSCDIRWLVAFHITRLVGFWFISLYRQGRLPYDFAVKGGVGDITVAGLAILVLLIPREAGYRAAALQVWNVLGLADILFVVGTAVRLMLADRNSLDELRHLPMSLPTFLVPIIIVTHGIIGMRVRRREI